jgi:mannose-1-phosphate guanylyltransferase
MMFFILAGGYGKRAEPLSLVKPKPAFPFNGVPLLALMLGRLRGLGCGAGFVNLHHLGAQVLAAAGDGSGIRFFEETELSGSRVLTRALPYLDGELLALNGDTFLDIPLAEMARRALVPGVDGVLLARSDRSGRYARLLCDGDHFLGNAPPAPKGEAALMYAGAALFKKRALARIDESNFFVSIRRQGLNFQVVSYDGIWLDVGTPYSYFQAHEDYMARSGREGANGFSPGVEVSPAARVRRSILWDNTRIGAGVALSSCIVTGDLALESGDHSQRIVSRLGVFPLA